jgi:hypothetical protein
MYYTSENILSPLPPGRIFAAKDEVNTTSRITEKIYYLPMVYVKR